MGKSQLNKTYATFGLARSYRQLMYAFRSRKSAEKNMAMLFDLVRRDEVRMVAQMGRPLEKMRFLEIGPGQGMERASYFGVKNTILGMDLDVIPQGMEINRYMQMIKENGLGRFAKTIGRKVILGRANAKAWAKVIGEKSLNYPKVIHGDICQLVLEKNVFDVIMSWSVFEHLPNPKQALLNVIDALKPGGIFYLSLHLYTSNNGHHDIRAFTGNEGALPLWAHLRPSTKAQIEPSSYLNEWRLSQWRKLFSEITPGHQEYLESYEHPEKYGPQLTGPLQQELSQYTKEELLTVEAIYSWKKPVH